MIKTLSFRSVLGFGLAVLFTQAVNANDGLSPEEANSIVKEDIASTQIMAEVCPAVIGKNAKLDANVKLLTQMYLKTTLAQ